MIGPIAGPCDNSLDASRVSCRCKSGFALSAAPATGIYYRTPLVDELVIDDGRCQSVLSVFLLRGIFGAHDPPLADDVAVLLAGNLLGHFENHLDERVDRKRLRTNEQYAALADVLDDSLKPCAGFVHAIAQGDVELQATGTRDPGRPFFARMAAANSSLWLVLHALGAAHGRPVILVFRCAQQANLVVVAIRTTAGPRELVRAAPKHKHIHEFLRHDGYFRVTEARPDAGSSSRDRLTLGRLLSCINEHRQELTSRGERICWRGRGG